MKLNEYKKIVEETMSRKRTKTPEQMLASNAEQLEREFAHWDYLAVNGCNDPFWPDGVNMNLTRNHVIYFKGIIQAINSLYRTGLPDVYYRETPQKVPDQYMAIPDATDPVQKKRMDRITQVHGKPKRTPLPDTNPQLTFL